MPYFNACYASNVNKIFATMGPYIVRCDPLTGQREAVTKLGAPIYGDLPICYNANSGYLFVGSGRTPNKQWSDAGTVDPPLFKDLYRIDPTTMAIIPCNIGAWTPGFLVYPFFPSDGLRGGVYALVPDGDYVLFLYLWEGGNCQWGRIHATTLALNGDFIFRWGFEHIGVGPTLAYTVDPYQREIQTYDKTLSYPFAYYDSAKASPYNPTAVTYCPTDGFPWMVCGDENLIRFDDVTVDFAYTLFTLLGVSGPTVPPDPCRIRCLSDGFLYLPCMSADGIIKFNPLTGTGVWFGGFESPIDVFETPTDKWAVQASPIGLKKIV